jgi:hypothetical protein
LWFHFRPLDGLKHSGILFGFAKREDRRAKKDGSDTCWVRVMQNWAGAGWGGQRFAWARRVRCSKSQIVGFSSASRTAPHSPASAWR